MKLYKILFLIITLVIVNTAGADEVQINKLQQFASFDGVEADGDYCEGYMMSFYKYKESLVGTLRYFEGQCADPSFGVLEDITYVPLTGDFSFSTRYLNRTAVRFIGKVSSSMLDGIFSLQDLNTGKLVNEKHLKLKAVKLEKNCRDCMSYDAWDKYAKERIDMLGR
jgi:hypothetical protein